MISWSWRWNHLIHILGGIVRINVFDILKTIIITHGLFTNAALNNMKVFNKIWFYMNESEHYFMKVDVDNICKLRCFFCYVTPPVDRRWWCGVNRKLWCVMYLVEYIYIYIYIFVLLIIIYYIYIHTYIYIWTCIISLNVLLLWQHCV